jgi:hypothetical protein
MTTTVASQRWGKGRPVELSSTPGASPDCAPDSAIGSASDSTSEPEPELLSSILVFSPAPAPGKQTSGKAARHHEYHQHSIVLQPLTGLLGEPTVNQLAIVGIEVLWNWC